MKFNVDKKQILLQKNILKVSTLPLKKKFLLKKKITGLKNSTGRNNSGKITIRHKGNGHKKKYREINFYRTKISTGIISSIEYDPNRNSNIASVYDFLNQTFFYVLAPKNLKIGDILKTSHTAAPKLGYSLPIAQIPIGSYIHNISSNFSEPAHISRAAGAFSKLKEKTLHYSTIELSSGKHEKILSKCYATLGVVSNELFFLYRLKKAGQSR